VVATNDGLYSVGARQADSEADYYYLFMLVHVLHVLARFQLMIVGVAMACLCACSVYGHTHAGARIHESFLREILFFTNSQKFSPSKISRYTVFLF
jgi:hypothetical protein